MMLAYLHPADLDFSDALGVLVILLLVVGLPIAFIVIVLKQRK